MESLLLISAQDKTNSQTPGLQEKNLLCDDGIHKDWRKWACEKKVYTLYAERGSSAILCIGNIVLGRVGSFVVTLLLLLILQQKMTLDFQISSSIQVTFLFSLSTSYNGTYISKGHVDDTNLHQWQNVIWKIMHCKVCVFIVFCLEWQIFVNIFKKLIFKIRILNFTFKKKPIFWKSIFENQI